MYILTKIYLKFKHKFFQKNILPVILCLIPYLSTLPQKQNLIDEFLLTKINKNYDGDTFFPIDFLAGWHSVIIDKTNNYQIYKFIK
ncbi:hypothetical protein SB78_05605 [Rickettsia asembonensis]|uniref:Uncharacterized protein n=1 Tax=Rickettsia asembonensis TaxID=1068590 RepID=A0A0C2QXD2_9RICK|nr:hypothetical protein SB78_05605 [Rickettsia asembonensis]